MTLRQWPDVLRSAGLPVKVHGEADRLSHGPMRDLNIDWHHDASPAGPSPGALDWMKRNWANASAQIWVDTEGGWHFISYGIAYHSGVVFGWAGLFSNPYAVGIETDHTVGEPWPDKQLSSLRRGTALLLKWEGKGADRLQFHKTIASPAGRKSDPHGLDLATERAHITRLQAGDSTIQEDDMPSVNDILMGATTIGYRDDSGNWVTETHPYAFWVQLLFNNQLEIRRGLAQLGVKIENSEPPKRVLFQIEGKDDTVYLAKLDANPPSWSAIPVGKADDVRTSLKQLKQPYLDFTSVTNAPRVSDPQIYGAQVEWDGSV